MGRILARLRLHGITAKTVEKHIARALQGLRQELGPDTFGQDGDT